MDRQQLDTIIALRHRLHAHPELSLEEKGTKALLMAFMQDHTDFEVTDCGAWFYCYKEPAGPSQTAPIAFRADMDALPIDETLDLPYRSQQPDVSHKCGHDGHSAALAGLGMALSGAGGADLKRPVYLIFQHAEEIGRGGPVCAQMIREKGIGEVYALHNLPGYPQGTIVLRKGLTQPASMGLTVTFQGRESHASNPEQGANPAYALADLVCFVRSQLALPHRGMTLCTIVGEQIGTGDFGVSAGTGDLSMTLRGEYEEEMRSLEAAIRARAQDLAHRDGLTVSFAVSDPFPETRNHDQALAKVEACARDLGLSVVHMQDLWRASEDFGCYLKACPGAIFYIGSGQTWPPLHTPDYDFNDRVLETAVDMFTALAKAPALDAGRPKNR
jgi:amidohydrolase